MSGHVEVYITRPNGVRILPVDIQGQDVWTEPGQEAVVEFAPVVLAQEGSYSANVVLKAGGQVLDQVTLDVALVKPALVISFSNPKYGASVWDVTLYDPGLNAWLTGDPSGIKEPHVACTFYPTGTTFLLRILELQYGGYMYWLGPYVVTVPEIAPYTWSSRDATLGGIPAVDLPHSNNQSAITGTLVELEWVDEGTWAAIVTIESAAAVGGYLNAAQFFIGQTIVLGGDIPLINPEEPALQVGRMIQATVRMVPTANSFYWEGWGFSYPREYPPEDYQFTGSLTLGEKIPVVDPETGGTYYRQSVNYQVSGHVSPFSVYIAQINIYGHVMRFWQLVGPGSGTVVVDDLYYSYLKLYAHPNPNAPAWNRYTWQLNHWQDVAYLPTQAIG